MLTDAKREEVERFKDRLIDEGFQVGVYVEPLGTTYGFGRTHCGQTIELEVVIDHHDPDWFMWTLNEETSGTEILSAEGFQDLYERIMS